MKKFLLALSAATLCGVAAPTLAATVHVPIGNAFLRGYGNPENIAVAAEKSFPTDPFGQKPIDATCHFNHNVCSSAGQLVDALNISDRGAAPDDVKGLPSYLRSLVLRPLPQNVMIWSACLVPEGNDIYYVKWDCEPRMAKPGEMGYYNPVTGRLVMLQDCSNPAGLLDEDHDCVFEHVRLRKGDKLRHYYEGQDAYPSGQCKPALKKAGSNEWGPANRDECPGCTGTEQFEYEKRAKGWSDSARIYTDRTSSFVADRDGDYVYRHPKEIKKVHSVLALCVTHLNGTKTQTTYLDMERTVFWHDNAYATYGTGKIVGWDNGVPHPWFSAASGEIEQ